MIDKQRIAELTAMIKSRAMSALESLSSIAATLRDEWKDETTILNLWGEVLQLYKIDDPNANIPLSSDSVDLLSDLMTNDKEIVLNTSTSRIVKLSLDQRGPEYADILINDEYSGIYDIENGTISTPVQSMVETVADVENVIYNHAQSCGFKYALADICDNAAYADWSTNTNLSTSIYNLIDSYRSTLGEYANDIVSAVAKGPIALVQLVQSLITKVKTMLDDGDLSGLLSSTSITLNKFAWGCVATSIGAVVTALGSVVMAFSRIAGVIMTVAGFIIQLVGRIFVSATTAFDDTQYKVLSGGDVSHCFSFVTESSTINSSGVANFMRQHGWNTMTVVCPHQATVYMMYLNDYDSDDDTITYEMHLSADIDISQVVKEEYIDETTYPAIVIPIPNDPYNETRPCSIAFLPKWNDNVQSFTQESMYMFKNTSSLVNTRASISTALRFHAIEAGIYSPVDFSLFDTLKQWYSNDLQNMIDIRLCSSIIIYTAYKLSLMLSVGWVYMSGNANTVIGVRHYSNSGFQLSAEQYLLLLWETAWNCFYNGNSWGSNSLLKSDFGLTDGQRGTLLSVIRDCFNQLYYKTLTPVGTITQQFIRVSNNGAGALENEEIGTAGHDLTIDDQEWIINNDQMFDSMYRDLSVKIPWSAGVWSTKCAISLPTLTFSGFIAGLIVDGIILAGVAAIAVVAVVGWIKIRNYRSKLQAKAEASWYEYEDGGQTDQQWKQYKSDRLKYNIVALCTGGQTLSLGLYDSTDSSADILSNIKGMFTSDEDDNDVSLKELVKLIKGVV